MENKDKNTALFDFIDMIHNSWTYARLTENERARMIKCLPDNSRLYGTYEQRYDYLSNCYYCFLIGLDYNPRNWRE